MPGGEPSQTASQVAQGRQAYKGGHEVSQSASSACTIKALGGLLMSQFMYFFYLMCEYF